MLVYPLFRNTIRTLKFALRQAVPSHKCYESKTQQPCRKHSLIEYRGLSASKQTPLSPPMDVVKTD